MSIITQGEQALRLDSDLTPGSEAHVRSIENSLRIVNVLLEKQAEFIELSRKAKKPVGNLFPFQSNRQLYDFLYSPIFCLMFIFNFVNFRSLCLLHLLVSSLLFFSPHFVSHA
jgi:hypothetical protein